MKRFHTRLLAALSASAGMSAGCQRYERLPLDLSAHHARFVARSPASPEVAEFVERLGASGAEGYPFDLTDGVSLQEAEAVAMVFNADLRLARLSAGVTLAAAENAGAWEDPSIGVDLTRIIESVAHPWKEFASIGLTIPVSGRLEIEKQRAGLEHAAELARLVEAEWRIRSDLRREWARWTARRLEAEAAREFLDPLSQVVSTVESLRNAGEIPRTEARLFQIEHVTARATLARAHQEAIEAELGIRQVMGLAPSAPITLDPGGFGDLTRINRPLEEPDIRGLERRSPALLVASAEYEAAEKSLELEIRRQYPDLHLGPGYGREDGQDQVLLGVSLPLPILNANRQGIAEARAKREVARANAETALERLLADLHRARGRLRSATDYRAVVESDIVPLVDQQDADTRRLAQLGEVNTLLLLDALIRTQQAKARLIEASHDEAVAAIRLAELLGPDPLDADEPTPPPSKESHQ